MSGRETETGHVIPRLMLTEVYPLAPFLMHREALTCVDVGGNTGLWCEAFLSVFGPRLETYHAYEPLPGNLERFRARLSHLNGAERVTLHPVCVGDATDDVRLHYDSEVTALASVPLSHVQLGRLHHKNNKSLLVPQVRLDDEQKNRIDILKIDTEGSEWQVLAGAENALRSGRIDNVLMEFGFHQAALKQSLAMFHALFRDYGFDLYRQDVDMDFFGFHPMKKCRWIDETQTRQYMLLASRVGPHPDYRGPEVLRRCARSSRILHKLRDWRLRLAL